MREPTSTDDGVNEFEAAATPPADNPSSTSPSLQLPAHDPAIASGYVVQVRATPDRAAADALQAALAGAGFPAFVVSGDNLYRVRVGRYRNEGDAERVAALLDARADIDETWITQG